MKENKNPKILLWDLETAGVNALYADLGFVVCFGYKWYGQKTTHCLTIDQFDGFRRHGFSDKGLLTAARKIMEEADLLVAHYGDKFDRKFFQGRCAINGLSPPPATKQRDTCLIARRAFKFRSNRLDALAKTLACKNRKQVKGDGWPDWWIRVMSHDRGALRKMAAYCKQDVRTLEDIYTKLRVYDYPHPRLFLDQLLCGVCGGILQKVGVRYAGKHMYQRLRCADCGKYDSGARLAA